MKLTGTNASLEITPESLKAQLEEQGFIVTEKPKPTVVWQRIEIEGDGPVQCWSYAGKTIPDELIQAYEELYEASEEDWRGFPQQRVDASIPIPAALIKIRAIKSRTAGK